ncbi:MAG: hypothetical protein ABL912_04325 [Novosphingobium sp.]
MASDASEQLNAIISKIDSADRTIDEARNQIHQICDTFDTLFAGNNWDADLTLPDLDTEIAQMTDVISHAAKDVAARVDGRIEAGITLLAHHGTELDRLRQDWDGGKQRALDACSELEESLLASLQKIEAGLDHLGQKLTVSGQALESAESALDKAFSDWESATSGELYQRLNDRFTAMVDQLGQTEARKIEQHLTEAQRQSDEAIEQLLTIGTQLVNGLSRTLGDAITQLQKHVGEEVANKLRETATALIETAVREILQSIIEAVATSQIGAQITAGMAPVLPELIAAKKLTDAILAAIRLWKDSIGRLTDPFDMF